MKYTALCLLFAGLAAGAPRASHPHLPYTFEKNQGQAPGPVRFLAHGASAGVIGLDFAGADRIRVTREGALELGFGSRRLLHQAPVAYQESAGRRNLVQVAYEMRGKDLVGFRVGAYDHTRPLVIDP